MKTMISICVALLALSIGANGAFANGTELAIPVDPQQFIVNEKTQKGFLLSSSFNIPGVSVPASVSVIDLAKYYDQDQAVRAQSVKQRTFANGTTLNLSGMVVSRDILYIGISYIGSAEEKKSGSKADVVVTYDDADKPLILKYPLAELENGTGDLTIDEAHIAVKQSQVKGHTLQAMFVAQRRIYFTLCAYALNSANTVNPHCYQDAKMGIYDIEQDKTTEIDLPHKNPIGMHPLGKDETRMAVLSSMMDRKGHLTPFDYDKDGMLTAKPSYDYSGFAFQMAYDEANKIAFICAIGDGGKLTYIDMALPPGPKAIGTLEYGAGNSSCSDVVWMKGKDYLFVADYTRGQVVTLKISRKSATAPLKAQKISPFTLPSGGHPRELKLYGHKPEGADHRYDLLVIWSSDKNLAYLSTFPTSEDLPPFTPKK